MTHRIPLARQVLCHTLFSVILLAAATLPAAGQTSFSTLYSFSRANLISPAAPLAVGADGSIYGASSSGGAYGYGVIFQLSPPSGNGTWKLSVLYSFKAGSGRPYQGLAIDGQGNLYGATQVGGDFTACPNTGCGTVYELIHPAKAGGGWTKINLHVFTRGTTDGALPYAAPIVDAAGTVYGSTAYGGTYDSGVIYRIVPGTGAETILYSFNANGGDGYYPESPLSLDAAGNLYGATSSGGTYGYGTAFKLSPGASGGEWTETILYHFGGAKNVGAYPTSGVVMDKSGNLFGTTQAVTVTPAGNMPAQGVLYKLSPPAAGESSWQYANLWSFEGNGGGSHPTGLAIDTTTNSFYGGTPGGGAYGGFCGIAYQLAEPAGGGGTGQFTVVHPFSGNSGGCSQYGSFVRDSAGNFYGATEATVFKITPQP